jgi:hypothetical protein
MWDPPSHMMINDKSMDVRFQSAMVSQRFCVRHTTSNETWSILRPWRNPCGLCIHLAFTYSVGPSSVVSNELGLAPSFPPMTVVEVQWSWALRGGLHHRHELVPRKMPYPRYEFMVYISWSKFLKNWFTKAIGPLTRYKPNVDQEECPCGKKWMCWFFLI